MKISIIFFSFKIVFNIFAGTPPTTFIGGTSRLITDPAATTAQLLIVTPGRIVAFEPIQTFFPIFIGE